MPPRSSSVAELYEDALTDDPEVLAARRARARWQVLILLLVIDVLVLAVGLISMVDLRRLQTPEGTALRWVQASVVGSCDDYLDYSVASPDRPDPRTEDEICRDLRVRAKKDSGQTYDLRLKAVNATKVQISLTRGDRTADVEVDLVRRDGAWRVLRNALTCDSVGCA
jgi:hypothetical protein